MAGDWQHEGRSSAGVNWKIVMQIGGRWGKRRILIPICAGKLGRKSDHWMSALCGSLIPVGAGDLTQAVGWAGFWLGWCMVSHAEPKFCTSFRVYSWVGRSELGCTTIAGGCWVGHEGRGWLPTLWQIVHQSSRVMWIMSLPDSGVLFHIRNETGEDVRVARVHD